MFVNFHEFDEEIEKAAINYDKQCVCEEVKLSDKWTPFLSFPITKKCNFRCVYCGQGGEATASKYNDMDFSFIKKMVDLAIESGVKKFRITGGEPFLHKDIKDILSFFSKKGVYTLVNTNGSLIIDNQDWLSNLSSNIRFAVSFDTLDEKKLKFISGVSNHKKIVNGLEFLKGQNLLLRCNMVVAQYNYAEIFDMIDFCKSLNCDLKLLDIVSVPVPYGKRSLVYQEINSLEKILLEKCDSVYFHEYTRGFGTPCLRYKFDNTFVTVKNSQKGSHYDIKGICDGCSYYPCNEGIYDIFALSDERLCACRWTEKQKYQNIEDQLFFLIKAFKRSQYTNTGVSLDMQEREDLK